MKGILDIEGSTASLSLVISPTDEDLMSADLVVYHLDEWGTETEA
jgi:hypothetical protein